MTAYGNSNTPSSNLNSRVIQMVIAKNLTLAQAWGILDLARTNTTSAVTSFPFFATSDFHTLGFAWEVSKLTANTSVVNGGNYSAPPPPPNLWRLYWNMVAGWAERAWNGILAVGTFFASVGKWLLDAAIGIAVGLATGSWEYFQDNVVEPFRKALDALLSYLTNLVVAILKPLLDPLLKSLRQWQNRMLIDAGLFVDASWIRYKESPGLGKVEAAAASVIIFGSEFITALILLGVIAGVIAVLFFVMPLLSVVIAVAFGIALLVVATQLGTGELPLPTGEVPHGDPPDGLRPQFDSHYSDVGGQFVGNALSWFFFLGAIFLDMLFVIAIGVEMNKGNPAFEVPAVALMIVLWIMGLLLIIADNTPAVSVVVKLWTLVFAAVLATMSFYLAVAEVVLGEIEILRGIAVFAAFLALGAFGKAYYDYRYWISKR